VGVARRSLREDPCARTVRRAAAGVLAAGLALAAAPDAGAVDRETCFSSAESAQTLRKAGHLRDARDKLTVCANATCPASVQNDCTNWAREVDAALPTIVVQAHDAKGNDLTDVRVVVDGKTFATRLDGKPIAVDPGSHALRIERAGATPVERSLVAVQGQKERVIDAELDVAVDHPAQTPTSRPIPLPVWILGGVGAAALVTTGVFWVWGRSDYSSLQGSCGESCNPSQVSPVRTKLVVGDVALGVGVVSLGLAAWFYFTRKTESPPAAEGAELFVTPAPGGAVAGVGAPF
jgi:hypothetical protein